MLNLSSTPRDERSRSSNPPMEGSMSRDATSVSCKKPLIDRYGNGSSNLKSVHGAAQNSAADVDKTTCPASKADPVVKLIPLANGVPQASRWTSPGVWYVAIKPPVDVAVIPSSTHV